MRLVDTEDCGERTCRIHKLKNYAQSDQIIIWPQQLRQLTGIQEPFSIWEVYIKFLSHGTRAREFKVCGIHSIELHNYWVWDAEDFVRESRAIDKWLCRMESQGDEF